MRIAILGAKGGSGRSITALALAHGLALEGRAVTLLELLPPGRASGIEPDRPWPFAYKALSLDGMPSGAKVMAAIEATTVMGDVILDPPPLSAADVVELLPSLALVLFPLHPDPLDSPGWQRLHRGA